MADTKISGLSALTGSTVSSQVDVIPIISTSATATRKITVQGLYDSVQGLSTVTSSTVSQADSMPFYSVSVAAARIMTVSSVATMVGNALTIPSAATQAQQETGTVTSAYVTPGRQQYHQSACKAWASITGGTTLSASYNVTSGSGGAGTQTVNFTTAFSSANYSIVATAFDATKKLYVTVISQASTSFVMRCYDDAGTTTEPTSWFIACYGDQA